LRGRPALRNVGWLFFCLNCDFGVIEVIIICGLNFPSFKNLESFVVAAFIDMKILLDFVF
jgi:hypothetical protein